MSYAAATRHVSPLVGMIMLLSPLRFVCFALALMILQNFHLGTNEPTIIASKRPSLLIFRCLMRQMILLYSLNFAINLRLWLFRIRSGENPPVNKLKHHFGVFFEKLFLFCRKIITIHAIRRTALLDIILA